MSETLFNIIIIFSELGLGLLVVIVGWAIYYICGTKKEGKATKKLIKQIKSILPKHEDKLNNYFDEDEELAKNKKAFNIKSLISDERKIYERLINVSVSKDTSMLKLTVDDIDTLINDYVRLFSIKSEVEGDEEKESTSLMLKKQNEALRLENISLKTRLDTSNETVENMMGEFSSMYEGGKKEGEQKLKNEIYQLKQSLDAEEVKIKSELKNLDNEDDS